MRLLDGLYLYEIIMLGMGVLLFLLLGIAFVVMLTRSKPYGRLLPAFGLPIVMVGFPAIQSIEISSDAVKVKTSADRLLSEPTDKEARASLTQAVSSLSDRPIRDPATSLSIARAQIALGQNAQAEKKIDQVLAGSPQLAEAQQLKRRVELDRQLVDLTAALQRDAGNPATRAALADTVRSATTMKIANPQTLASMAQAQTELGQHEEATKSAAKALAIDPHLAAAIQLKKETHAAPAAAATRPR